MADSRPRHLVRPGVYPAELLPTRSATAAGSYQTIATSLGGDLEHVLQLGGPCPEQIAAEFGVSRSTLYWERRKHPEGAAAEPVGPEG
ncbi:hypothetical protein ABZ746_24500 [Streptomyces sp. NPDC020096]